MIDPNAEKKLLIFLSHASEDKVRVRNLCKRLKEDGFDPWLDEERLLPGQNWDLEIEKALRTSDAILLCFSSVSVTKEGYIQREYKRSMRYQEEKPEGTIFVIPVQLDDCEPPHFIREIQYVDYSTGYERLLLALQTRATELQIKTNKTSSKNSSSNQRNQETATVNKPSPSTIRLRYFGLSDASPVIETHERMVTIGRAPKNMVVVTDTDVSWEHGSILLMLDGYIYRHFSNSSSTIIRRKGEEFLLRPGRNEEVVLRNQDRITIGKTTFIIEFNLVAEDTGYTTTHKKAEN
ncbi:MAG TPA: TIR domain-containing protein [Anaerolineales bacterium]|nr:TIR domain-containing protein [Anaerolineales bacterium]